MIIDLCTRNIYVWRIALMKKRKSTRKSQFKITKFRVPLLTSKACLQCLARKYHNFTTNGSWFVIIWQSTKAVRRKVNIFITHMYDKKLIIYFLIGYCYLWDETNGRRGSSEIGTCLLEFLKSLPAYVEHVILYSDNCAGQNRNQYVAALLLLAVHCIDHIKVIEHKFLTKGHTQMECDAMHSAIEFAKREQNVYTVDCWATILRMARRKKPYKVKQKIVQSLSHSYDSSFRFCR